MFRIRNVHTEVLAGKSGDQMSSHTDEFEDVETHRGTGVRTSTVDIVPYELAVLGLDVSDVVRSAGGWICDRVRAGWRVCVQVPAASDLLPLKILGVTTFETDLGALLALSPAAFAVASGRVDNDTWVRRYVRYALQRGVAEITFWGDRPFVDANRPLGAVEHRLSSVARAFKSQALSAATNSYFQLAPAEAFHSAALWYPPDSSDLVPANACSRERV
jgi:hypothetical protein